MLKTKIEKRRAARRSPRKWSARVTRTSHAMDLEPGVFSGSDPKKIAASVKHSAEISKHRKANPYRSALSMITFYVNRGGRNFSGRKKATLERAKMELKRLFGRE